MNTETFLWYICELHITIRSDQDSLWESVHTRLDRSQTDPHSPWESVHTRLDRSHTDQGAFLAYLKIPFNWSGHSRLFKNYYKSEKKRRLLYQDKSLSSFQWTFQPDLLRSGSTVEQSKTGRIVCLYIRSRTCLGNNAEIRLKRRSLE